MFVCRFDQRHRHLPDQGGDQTQGHGGQDEKSSRVGYHQKLIYHVPSILNPLTLIVLTDYVLARSFLLSALFVCSPLFAHRQEISAILLKD